MAHFILEYSANLGGEGLRLDQLMEKLHACAIGSGIFPAAGVRSRAICYQQYRVADGDPRAAFFAVTVKVGSGRDVETRKAVGKELFQVVTDHLAAIYAARPLAISFELTELDPDVRFNQNNLHGRAG